MIREAWQYQLLRAFDQGTHSTQEALHGDTLSAMCCQDSESPACEDSGSKNNHKRNLSNGTSELSPPRRSKRQKSTTNLKELSSPEASESEAEESTPAVKKEADDTPLVDTAKEKKKKAPVKKAPVKKESNEDVKPKKARKSKKDQEIESMPLAPRTKGLRMFVGAHVSAAKGQCSRHLIVSIR